MLLPPGFWMMNANGHFADLNISVAGDGSLSGDMAGDQILGLWDEASRKIVFTRLPNSNDPLTAQVFTGYLIIQDEWYFLAGSFEAFEGTSATARRAVFGWKARFSANKAPKYSNVHHEGWFDVVTDGSAGEAVPAPGGHPLFCGDQTMWRRLVINSIVDGEGNLDANWGTGSDNVHAIHPVQGFWDSDARKITFVLMQFVAGAIQLAPLAAELFTGYGWRGPGEYQHFAGSFKTMKGQGDPPRNVFGWLASDLL